MKKPNFSSCKKLNQVWWNQSIYIYIYIHKSKELNLYEKAWGSAKWCILCKENWNVFKWHIRDNNKLNIDFLFYLVQSFKIFLIKNKCSLYLLVQCMKIFHSSHIHSKLCISIHNFHFLHFYPFIIYIKAETSCEKTWGFVRWRILCKENWNNILKCHIIDKNKLNINFLIYLVQCFKTFLIKQ